MQKRRLLLSLLTLVVITGVSVITILYARGYQLNPSTGGVIKTGLLVVGSQPDGATVYLDGHLTSATNTTISYLLPKTYHVRITKEGYLPWEKTVAVKQELVTKIEAVLWPISPELKPLTFTGIQRPTLSPDGQKLAFLVPSGLKAGIWVMDLSDRTFFLPRDPRQLAADTPSLLLSTSTLEWSPDSRQVLVRVQEENPERIQTYLLDSDRTTTNLLDVTPTIHAVLAQWEVERRTREEARIERLEASHRDIFARFNLISLASQSAKPDKVFTLSPEATSSAKLPIIPFSAYRLVWSPNETRVMLFPKDGKPPLVYDLKTKGLAQLPEAKFYAWYPEQTDSRHIVLVREKSISLIEFDGANETQVYTGQFDNGYVFPWPTGGRLVILTSYNTGAGELSNLYSVNLR